MDAAHTIRQALGQVSALRARAHASPKLNQHLQAVKRFQALRFAGTYQDLLQSGQFAAPTRFFLEELYGEQDFADRDRQFAKIAGALQTFFPSHVISTAVALAQLHAMTEGFDWQMAEHCAKQAHDSESVALSSKAYLQAWRALSNLAGRQQQLQTVLMVGHDLDQLTRTKGLRLTLRMMRGPAKAAGLVSLQSFLETGFDTFADMGQKKGATAQFLEIIKSRENAWIETLFDAPASSCEAQLVACLGKSHK